MAEDAVASGLSELEGLDSLALIQTVLSGDARFGRVCVVSSFGAEAPRCYIWSRGVDRSTPIFLLDTRKLFGETLRYAEMLRESLKLGDLRLVRPDPDAVRGLDPVGDLWRLDPDACCDLRKVRPLRTALSGGFDTSITGRKRFQSTTRAALPKIEMTEGRLKINPLASWTKDDIDGYFALHGLPRHPLEADGFLSIGCFTCTDRVAPGEDIRAGRWRGLGKTECGIHLPAPGAGARLPGR